MITQTAPIDDHQARDDPGREVHRELPEDGLPDAPGKHQQDDDREPARRCTRRGRGRRRSRANGTRLTITSDTPSMSGVAAFPRAPTHEQRAPSARPTPPSTSQRRRRRTTGGSGRFRIAVEIVIMLTRQAENATTTSVSSTPSANAISRLRQRDGVLDLEARVRVLRAERPRHHEHHPVRDDRAEQRPDGRGDEVVRGALEHEHLAQVAAPRADRAGDAELAAPLGGEHHEDEEDQQDPGGDRERAERREERHERASGLVGGLDRVLLDRLDLERVRLGASARASARPRPRARRRRRPPPRFEIITCEHVVRAAEKLLRLASGSEQRRVRGRRRR